MKTPASFSTGPKGSDIVNFFPETDGILRRVEATKNAVIIQMIEAPQEDGTMEYLRLISIECVDPEMLPVLKEQAHRLMAI